VESDDTLYNVEGDVYTYPAQLTDYNHLTKHYNYEYTDVYSKFVRVVKSVLY
jgi:hypothetical protein